MPSERGGGGGREKGTKRDGKSFWIKSSNFARCSMLAELASVFSAPPLVVFVENPKIDRFSQ